MAVDTADQNPEEDVVIDSIKKNDNDTSVSSEKSQASDSSFNKESSDMISYEEENSKTKDSAIESMETIKEVEIEFETKPEEKPEAKPESKSEAKSETKSSETIPTANGDSRKVEKIEKNGINGTKDLKIKNQVQVDNEEKKESKSEFSILVLIVKIIVIIFDVITFPIYYLIQQPWKKLEKQRRIKACLEDPNDPYSAYYRISEGFNNHYVFKAKTVSEAQYLSLKLNKKDNNMLGRRRINNVVIHIAKNGKQFLKYDLSDYEWFTISQVDEMLSNLVRGFATENIKYQDFVLIFAETRMEWFLCAQALWRMGVCVCTLYATLGLEAILYGINDTKVEHIITTTDLLPLLLKIVSRAKNVKKIYVIDVHPGILKGEKPKTEEDFNNAIKDQLNERPPIKLVSYDSLLKTGFVKKDDVFDIKAPSPKDSAVVLYTSGSTGNPKGVVFTHKNLITGMHAAYTALNETIIDNYDSHIYFAALPLSHMFEMLVELAFFSIGMKIGYGSPYTMTDNGTAILPGQKGDLKMLRPTIMACVPLLLDRIRKTITERLERRKSVFWTQLIKFLVAYKNYWLERGFDTPIINNMICSRLNGNLGGRVQMMVVGAAPLSPDTQRMMRSLLNVQILQGYGATELCGAATIMDLEDTYLGCIGSLLRNIKIRLVDWPEGGYSVHDKPNPRGELVVGGPSVVTGYHNLPEKSAEVFEVDQDGISWFKTGDIGEVDHLGVFKIIDRKKDLVKLQFGEYISLGKVESELKTIIYIDNVCVYGDSFHSYVIALVQPARSSFKFLGKELGKGDMSYEELCDDKEMIEHLTKVIIKHCTDVGLHKMEIPQKILLCKEEWTQDLGLTTASMKIKRKEIQKYYQDKIYQLYGKGNDKK